MLSQLSSLSYRSNHPRHCRSLSKGSPHKFQYLTFLGGPRVLSRSFLMSFITTMQSCTHKVVLFPCIMRSRPPTPVAILVMSFASRRRSRSHLLSPPFAASYKYLHTLPATPHPPSSISPSLHVMFVFIDPPGSSFVCISVYRPVHGFPFFINPIHRLQLPPPRPSRGELEEDARKV